MGFDLLTPKDQSSGSIAFKDPFDLSVLSERSFYRFDIGPTSPHPAERPIRRGLKPMLLG